MTPDSGGVSGNGSSSNISGNDSSGSNLSGQNNSSLNLMNMGSLLKVMGSVSGGVASYRSYQSKADADRFNASIATQNAATTGQETASNAEQLNMLQEQKIGQQRANLAQANIGPISQGSAADAITTSERNANMQRLTEEYKGTLQRYSYMNDANMDNYYAKVADSNATTSLVNTGLSATSQLLQGYNKYQNGAL